MNTVVLVTAGYDHKIRFWEPPSGLCTRTLRFVDSQVNSLKITPDKHFLAAAGNPIIRLFEINSSNPNPFIRFVCAFNGFEGHSHNVTEVGFHREGKWLYSCSEDGTARIWDLRAPNCQMTHENKAAVNTCQLHPNQAEVLFGDQAGVVKTWDLTADRTIQLPSQNSTKRDTPIRSISIELRDLMISPELYYYGCDGPKSKASDASLLVVGNTQADMTMYTPDSAGVFEAEKKGFKAHDNGYLLKCVLSPDTNVLVTTSSDKTAKVWDAASGDWSLLASLTQHQRWVWDAVFSADSSYLVTASSDHTARLFDLRNGDVIRHYIGHSLSVTCVALNDNSS